MERSKTSSRYLGLLIVTALLILLGNQLLAEPFSGGSLLISAADDSAKKAANKTVLFVGNSLTAGYGLDPSQAFPALIQQKIDSSGWQFEVVNAGLSGETSSGGLRRIDWLLKRRIDVLVLELGANDALRGIALALTKKNLQSIIEKVKAKYPRVRVVIAGMRAPPNLGIDYTKEFQAIFPALVRKYKAVLIPFLLEGVGGIPELNLPDGIHPTAEGHRIVAENIWEFLQPLIEKSFALD